MTPSTASHPVVPRPSRVPGSARPGGRALASGHAAGVALAALILSASVVSGGAPPPGIDAPFAGPSDAPLFEVIADGPPAVTTGGQPMVTSGGQRTARPPTAR